MAFVGLRERMKAKPKGPAKDDAAKKRQRRRPSVDRGDVGAVQTFLLSKGLPIAREKRTAPDYQYGRRTNQSLLDFMASEPTDKKDKAIKAALAGSGLVFSNWRQTLPNLKGVAEIIRTGGKAARPGAAARPENFIDWQMPAVMVGGKQVAPAREVKNFPYVAAVLRKGPGVEAALRNWGVIPDAVKGVNAVPYFRAAAQGLIAALRAKNLQGNANLVNHIIGGLISTYQKGAPSKRGLQKGIDLVRDRFEAYLWRHPRGGQVDKMIEGWLKSRRLTDREGWVTAPNKFRDNWPLIYSYLTRTLKLRPSTPKPGERPAVSPAAPDKAVSPAPARPAAEPAKPYISPAAPFVPERAVVSPGKAPEIPAGPPGVAAPFVPGKAVMSPTPGSKPRDTGAWRPPPRRR